eukprot:5956740-Prymnesium_polylepis.1
MEATMARGLAISLRMTHLSGPTTFLFCTRSVISGTRAVRLTAPRERAVAHTGQHSPVGRAALPPLIARLPSARPQ